MNNYDTKLSEINLDPMVYKTNIDLFVRCNLVSKNNRYTGCVNRDFLKGKRRLWVTPLCGFAMGRFQVLLVSLQSNAEQSSTIKMLSKQDIPRK